MRTVLITGGAGFIGSHLGEAVLAAGDAVVAVDDLSTGSYRNVDHLSGGSFELVVASVEDAPTMEGLIRRADLVYHLAAAVGVKLIVDDPVRTIETNIRGTEVVLRLANKWRRPVVLASTSEVYGKSERVPYAEDHDMVLGPTTHSRWSYAASNVMICDPRWGLLGFSPSENARYRNAMRLVKGRSSRIATIMPFPRT